MHKKVLIFTASFGEGHNTAARNVRDALEHMGGSDVEVDIIDLFDECYGKVNDFFRTAYITAINKSPKIWQSFYNILDNTTLVQNNLSMLARMRSTMKALLHEARPDVVCSTYPVYNYIINEIYNDREDVRSKNFTQLTIVTDSISVNSIWYQTQCDCFIVPNQETADVMIQDDVPQEKIRVFGFPVQMNFAEQKERLPSDALQSPNEEKKILYIINSGKKKSPRIIQKLLKLDNVKLTVAVGRDEKLRHDIVTMLNTVHANKRENVDIIGWTTKMPELLMSHHLVISKAGGATVQESIAAECPMVVNQVVPGQEEGNYELLRRNNCGELANKPSEVAELVEEAFRDKANIWRMWKENIRKISRPEAQLRIAEFILQQAVPDNISPPTTLNHIGRRESKQAHRINKSSTDTKSLLMCDLHTHTTYSDGKLHLRDLVDFYGQRGFDVICVTDHICDYKKFFGKVCDWTGLVLPYEQMDEYFSEIEKERQRAWKKYSMIVMTGLEFNKDGLRPKTSTHLLGVDLKTPIDPSQDLKQIILEIHHQGGLAIAAHPHKIKSVWGKDTLYLWDNQEEYAPLIDAWEIGNRDDLFNPIGLKRLPFIASSDFHKPKHIRSWKTMLYCEKEAEAIKQCIRVNRDVAVTLYRDHIFAETTERLIEKTVPKKSSKKKKSKIPVSTPISVAPVH